LGVSVGDLLLGGNGSGLSTEGLGGRGGGWYSSLGGTGGGVTIVGSSGDCNVLVTVSSSSLGCSCCDEAGFGLLKESGLGDDGVWGESLGGNSDIDHGNRGFTDDLDIVPPWFFGLCPGDFKSYVNFRGYSKQR